MRFCENYDTVQRKHLRIAIVPCRNVWNVTFYLTKTVISRSNQWLVCMQLLKCVCLCVRGIAFWGFRLLSVFYPVRNITLTPGSDLPVTQLKWFSKLSQPSVFGPLVHFNEHANDATARHLSPYNRLVRWKRQWCRSESHMTPELLRLFTVIDWTLGNVKNFENVDLIGLWWGCH